MVYTNAQLRLLLERIEYIAGRPYDRMSGNADDKYAFALGMIAGLAKEAREAVAENRPMRFNVPPLQAVGTDDD